MWFLFHRKAKTEVVSGGEVLREHCPTCARVTQLVEVEVKESYGVWFVDVIDDKERAFRCTSCGEVFDRRDNAPAPEQSKWSRVEEMAAEQRKRDATKAQIATKIDDELAELKRRMGRA